MKSGKLNWEDLEEIINKNRGAIREDITVRGGIGEDCSVINFGEYECVLSTDPITGASKDIGKLAVHINCNDIASSGVEPVGLLVTILAPEGTKIEEIKGIMSEVSEECKKLNIEILGGHTEVTKAVNKLIVSCTAIGKGKKNSSVSTAGAKIGDDIVVTKSLCLEGTTILINDYYDISREILTEKEIQEALSYGNNLSVLKEGILAGKFGVNCMHDITEGGVLGALWEISSAGTVGFKVKKENMPISAITQKICDRFGIDPLKFISSGSMIMTCNNGYKLVERLNEEGIEGKVIGKITEGEKILTINGEEQFIDPPERDELFNIKI